MFLHDYLKMRPATATTGMKIREAVQSVAAKMQTFQGGWYDILAWMLQRKLKLMAIE